MSVGAIAAMISVLILTTAVPLGGMIFLHRRGGTWKAFLVGAGTFILFALVLEQILHSLVLLSGAGAMIQGNIWLYGLYGGLAAGIFEETGRFLAFRYVLRNVPGRITALSYGIGHGGIEAFILVGLTMIANLSLGLAYTGGAELSAEMTAMAETLVSTPAGMFLWAGFERLTAMALHVSLSVLVCAAVRTGKRWMFPAAILLHGAVDFTAVVSNAYLPVAATEGLVLLLTILAAVWAARVYRKLS
ncbi:MAG: YhfC family intramembrane metalloprotease [Oscillibacter sp.]|nr:YhfC family intramembrane metalloprotease [Oscillibacter sp.]